MENPLPRGGHTHTHTLDPGSPERTTATIAQGKLPDGASSQQGLPVEDRNRVPAGEEQERRKIPL